MTPEQLRQVDSRLNRWREIHPDTASRRAAYRERVWEFTLNSMALAGEPVDPACLVDRGRGRRDPRQGETP